MKAIGGGRWIALAAALVSMHVSADDENLVVVPDEFVFCTVCHGVQLMGNENLDSPRLSQMDAWHVEQQLLAFKYGWRGTHPQDVVGMEMQPMAAVLSEEQIERVAEIVSATRSPLPATTVDGDPAAGERHYRTCAACHGVNGEGNESLAAPALTGLDDWYLVRQLENYLNGVRGSDPADTYGQQMRASTGVLRDEQAIRDVVRYITTLPTN